MIGGSASGKSDYAERHVLSLEGGGPRIYIATMEPFGEEARARIARHHALRRDRGFETIECYRNIGSLRLPADSNVLLEDLGNLMANELFGNDAAAVDEETDLPDRIAEEIEKVFSDCAHMTIVTNEIFSGGKKYEGETLKYLRALAEGRAKAINDSTYKRLQAAIDDDELRTIGIHASFQFFHFAFPSDECIHS